MQIRKKSYQVNLDDIPERLIKFSWKTIRTRGLITPRCFYSAKNELGKLENCSDISFSLTYSN
jgi:hypothetical protein